MIHETDTPVLRHIKQYPLPQKSHQAGLLGILKKSARVNIIKERVGQQTLHLTKTVSY